MIPSEPFTSPKFKTGFAGDPVIVAVADPDNSVDTVPIVNAGVDPSEPFTNPKFKTGFVVDPVIVAVDSSPYNIVDTVPMVKFGVRPVWPITPTVLKIAVIRTRPPPDPPYVLNVHVSPKANATLSPVTIFDC